MNLRWFLPKKHVLAKHSVTFACAQFYEHIPHVATDSGIGSGHKVTHCTAAAGPKRVVHIANRTAVVIDHTESAPVAVNMIDHIVIADKRAGSQVAVMRQVLGEVDIEQTGELVRNNQRPGTEVVVRM